MLVFDDILSANQESAVRSIYTLLRELPEEVRRVIAKDLAATYGTGSDG